MLKLLYIRLYGTELHRVISTQMLSLRDHLDHDVRLNAIGMRNQQVLSLDTGGSSFPCISVLTLMQAQHLQKRDPKVGCNGQGSCRAGLVIQGSHCSIMESGRLYQEIQRPNHLGEAAIPLFFL